MPVAGMGISNQMLRVVPEVSLEVKARPRDQELGKRLRSETG